MEDSYYASIVTSAAALLDAASPGWERHVDVSKLDMQSGSQCILGQVGQVRLAEMGATVSAHFGAVGDVWELPTGEMTIPYLYMKQTHGFPDTGAFASRGMVEPWTSLIKERFNAGALSDA